MAVYMLLREFGDQLPRTDCAMQSPDSAMVRKESHGDAIKNCFNDLEKEIKVRLDTITTRRGETLYTYPQSRLTRYCLILQSSAGNAAAKPPIYKKNISIEKKPSLGPISPAENHALDGQQGGQPSRQASLGADFGLLRTKTSSGSQNVFNEVLDQVCVGLCVCRR